MARLRDIEKEYRVGFRHNPNQFYPNSFRVEGSEKRLLLVAVVKRHVGKNFRIVGVLKPRRRFR